MKKWFIILGICCFSLTMIMITNSYALFETDATGVKNVEIGKWNILLNETDISLARTLNITDFTYSETERTEDNYFAPGRELSFEVNIDVANTEVSVEYEIVVDDTALEEHPNIKFKFYDEDTHEEITSNEKTGVILLTDPSRVKHLKIILDWSDELQYDEEDTSLINKELEFSLHANFKQYLGE